MANGDENNKEFLQNKAQEAQFAKEALDFTKAILKAESDRREQLGGSVSLQRSLIKALTEQQDIEDKILDGTFRAEDVAQKQAKTQDLLKKLEFEKQQLIEDNLGDNEELVGVLDDQIDRAKRLAAAQGAGVKKIEDSGNAATKTFNFLESSAGVLQKNLRLPKGFTSGIGKMAKGARGAAIAGGGLGKALMGAFKALRLNPFGLILTAVVGLVKALIEANNKITALAKGLAVSKNEARAINARLNEAAMSAGILGVNSTEVKQAFADINNFLGLSSTVIKGDLLVGVAELQKRTGLTKEAAMGFAQASLQSGKGIKEIAIESVGAAKAAEREFGARVDIKGVLKEAGQTTGLIRANLGANPAAIAKAAASAKLLGTNLKDVAAAGKQLLNFEESISNELEAELLTGKQINLERARLAALTGDQETLGKELLAQVGDFNDFSKMNVIQQEALAKSIGMQADQLADILLKQGNIAELKEKARKEGNLQTLQQLEQLSTQEKFNEAIAKLKDFVVILVEKLESGTGLFGALFGSDSAVSEFAKKQNQVDTATATNETKIDYNEMASAMSRVNIKVATEYDAYSSRNNSSYNGVAQGSARHDTKFT